MIRVRAFSQWQPLFLLFLRIGISGLSGAGLCVAEVVHLAMHDRVIPFLWLSFAGNGEPPRFNADFQFFGREARDLRAHRQIAFRVRHSNVNGMKQFGLGPKQTGFLNNSDRPLKFGASLYESFLALLTN
jgi:hypothetical protein